MHRKTRSKNNLQEEFVNSRFESQSETIINHLVIKCKMPREKAMKLWFESKTYEEIVRRKLTYLSAMKALHELKLEKQNSENWMKMID